MDPVAVEFDVEIAPELFVLEMVAELEFFDELVDEVEFLEDFDEEKEYSKESDLDENSEGTHFPFLRK